MMEVLTMIVVALGTELVIISIVGWALESNTG
jgi:nitrogen fixation-related uncharacterized protein